MIREFGRAILTKDIPEENLKAGDVGTVVDVHEDGAGYSLEFFALNGETLAVVTVTADAVRPVGERQIAHARDL